MASIIMLAGAGVAQTPPAAGTPAPPVTIAFRNDCKAPIILQGCSLVNGVQRRGQPIFIPAGKVNFDSNVPPGIRQISIFDANQPSRVLLLNFQLAVQPGRDLQLIVRPAPNNPNRVILAPEPKPGAGP